MYIAGTIVFCIKPENASCPDIKSDLPSCIMEFISNLDNFVFLITRCAQTKFWDISRIIHGRRGLVQLASLLLYKH